MFSPAFKSISTLRLLESRDWVGFVNGSPLAAEPPQILPHWNKLMGRTPHRAQSWPAVEFNMSTEMIVIVLVLVLLFGGGGFFYSRRGRR
jgi:hypothetical protein